MMDRPFSSPAIQSRLSSVDGDEGVMRSMWRRESGPWKTCKAIDDRSRLSDYRSAQSDSATAVAVCPSTVSQACGPCRCGCASTHPETCMSDLLLNHPEGREPLQASFSYAANPLGLDGIEFIE